MAGSAGCQNGAFGLLMLMLSSARNAGNFTGERRARHEREGTEAK